MLKHGSDQDFAARWVLGGIPAVNLRTLSAKGILLKVGSARQGHRVYYRMLDMEGVAKALREIGLLS